MIIKFLGCGSAFNKVDGQSSVLITVDNKNLLFDCGSYLWLHNQDIAPKDIDAFFISHVHGDHCGGVEELAFMTYFDPNKEKPTYCGGVDYKELWENTLSGGLGLIDDKKLSFEDYFEIDDNCSLSSFRFSYINFNKVSAEHVSNKKNYGLFFETLGLNTKVWITSDIKFNYERYRDHYEKSDIIFHDCETAPYNSGVHASYEQLLTLPADVRKKIWLYHYQPNPKQKADEDGFLGFVSKNQEFYL